MLDFQPELEETMKARYKDALTPIYDVYKIPKGNQNPENLRKHVFDFYDGVRLVVTQERRGFVILSCFVFSLNERMEFECVGQFMAFVIEHINSIKPHILQGNVEMIANGKAAVLVVNEYAAKAHLN